MSPPFDAALARVRAGEGAEAERIMVDAARAAAAEHGKESASHAAALTELASILVASNDFSRAAEALQRAVAIRPPGPDAEKARLTYAMNLGDILQRLGKLDEAEQVLRASLADRERLYGTEHAGYAYGLEALADVLRARGATTEARAAIDGAVRIFWNAANPQITSALATRAAILAAAGESAFGLAPELPDGLYDELVEAVLRREEVDPPEHCLRVLEELLRVDRERRGAESGARLPILAAITRVARAANAHDARRHAMLALRSAFEAQGDDAQALEATMALALAEDEAGDSDASRRHHVDAIARADRLGDATAQASARRNYGIFLTGKPNDQAGGRKVMQEAIRIAEHGGATEMAARTRVALGLNLQHSGELASAWELLVGALRDLAPTHADALCARSHLEAIDAGGSCGCGDMDAVLAQTVRAMVEKEIGPGLIGELVFDEGGKIQVGLTRAPSPEEGERLDRVLRHALASLRSDLRK